MTAPQEPSRARPWTHRESLFLAQAYERCGVPWCASELHRTVEDCVARLKALGAGQDAEWLDIGSAGRLASCSGSTIRALVVSGAVEARKTPAGRREVRRESVLAYAAEHQRVTEQSGYETPKGSVRRKKKSQMPKNTPKRPVEAKKGAGMENPPSEAAGVAEGPSEAQNGHISEKPAEAGQDLASMSKLDILRAIASGQNLEAGRAG